MPRNPYKDRTCNLCRHCWNIPIEEHEKLKDESSKYPLCTECRVLETGLPMSCAAAREHNKTYLCGPSGKFFEANTVVVKRNMPFMKTKAATQKKTDREKLTALQDAFRKAHEVFFKKVYDMVKKGVL